MDGSELQPNGKKNTADNKQEWVQFDDEGHEIPVAAENQINISPAVNQINNSPAVNQINNSPAVLDTQAVQVTLQSSISTVDSVEVSPKKFVSESASDSLNHSSSKSIPVNQTNASANRPLASLNPANLQNVPLNEQSIINSHARPGFNQESNSTIRQGFANGDVIVTILPQNTSLPWITPAKFRPELVPEELMAQGLTLTVEDYVHVMSQLVNDHRFTVYNMCYKRVLMAWITLAFFILLCILFGNFKHMVMFGLGIAWLMINAGAIFFCMWIKIKLNKNLERCLSRINLQLMKHKIMLGCDDRGKISCHKLNLVFIYFDPQECIDKLQKLIENDAEANQNGNRNQQNPIPSLCERYDVDDPEIIITGSTNTRINQQQGRARHLLARYSQRWVKLIVRGGLSLGIDASLSSPSHSPTPPKHMSTRQCPCQYIQDHLHYKPEVTC